MKSGIPVFKVVDWVDGAPYAAAVERRSGRKSVRNAPVKKPPVAQNQGIEAPKPSSGPRPRQTHDGDQARGRVEEHRAPKRR